MTHEHGPHDHDHAHPHTHAQEHGREAALAPELDVSVDDSDLSPAQLGRRTFLQAAGLLGAGAATASVLGGVTAGHAAASPTPAQKTPKGGYR